jgi:fructose-1-phosphate kinase PfkB-like protein
VNELEAEELTNISFDKIEDAKKMIQSLTREKGCNIVIVTLGKQGAAYNDDDKIIHVSIPFNTVPAIDSTGN